jgi:hypothetical protein
MFARRYIQFTTHGLLALVAMTAAYAGPDFFEGSLGEAGSTPATAQTPTGSGTLQRIHGELGGSGAGPIKPDFEDMFLIDITDPINFRATTVPPMGSARFDTQLWLFAGHPDKVGFGQLANDNTPEQPLRTEGGPLTGSLLLPVATDPTMLSIGPGLHYIAISGVPNLPLSQAGPIFLLLSPTEISGPDGPGGILPIQNWTGPGQTGEYVIYLDGVSFPPQPCLADLDGDGQVGFGDLLVLLSQWGPCPPDPPCPGDFDGSGDVNFADLLFLLAAWGPCGPT